MLRSSLSLGLMGLLVLSLVLLAGCGGKDGGGTATSSDVQPPTVVVNAPVQQAILPAGQAIPVSVIVNDDQSIARIELYVDNSLIESRVTPTGSVLTTKSEQFTWSASIVGPHTLQVRAYDATGPMGASAIVAVEVRAGSGGEPAPEPTSPPAEATATPAPPTAPPATATPESALVTANVNANVRSGPGTNYPVVGGLAEAESALVTGRNADGSWWQISLLGQSAWIANSVVTANAQASSAPVVSAPPPPVTNTPLPPTATPTPVGPTATPIPTTGFRVDQTNLSAGQCTTLRWDFDNINAIRVSFGLGYEREGQPGHGSRQVCPSVTTTYEAEVLKQDSSAQTYQATVNVSGSGCGDPYITRFVSTIYEVAAGTPFSIFWEVDCAKSVKYIKGSSPEQSVGGHDKKIDVTINNDTTFRLKVEKNDGGFVYASFVVRTK
jgi:uncharacterized protein YgiM (DUF1202 family)